MIDFDAHVLAANFAAFSQEVVWFRAHQAPLTVRGIFDDRYRETSFRDGVEIIETRPVLGLRVSSFPGRLPPMQAELFQIGGRLYAVTAPPETDGRGHCKVSLRYASDQEAALHALMPT